MCGNKTVAISYVQIQQTVPIQHVEIQVCEIQQAVAIPQVEMQQTLAIPHGENIQPITQNAPTSDCQPTLRLLVEVVHPDEVAALNGYTLFARQLVFYSSVIRRLQFNCFTPDSVVQSVIRIEGSSNRICLSICCAGTSSITHSPS
ncbi:hypothetical protein CHS0354_004549 [Potamilus streckersoni]|uniref:Uncharacterized protein n=1 Tax=Potamilus streckersoni TaxID=2493646 RepID=A0AAE0VPX5_9BIVA|nr:hypothetical protein CHS0354_004549 [Potamilus streckersoni]